ncbi:MAG: hypothetical protein ACYC4L_11390 [Chloroflexota bacterium]
MANSWKTMAKKYLKEMHGSRAALKKASAAYHGQRVRNPRGRSDLMTWVIVGGVGYLVSTNWPAIQAKLRPPAATSP